MLGAIIYIVITKPRKGLHMTQYPKFVQPKYCPYALKQEEADVLLTENNSMDPEEWDMFADSPLAGGDTTYENHIYAGLFRDLVALAKKTKGDIFWHNDAPAPIHSTGFYPDTQGSEIVRWETPNWCGLSQLQRRVVIASNASRGFGLLAPTTVVVTVRATDDRGAWTFMNLAVVWQ